MEIEGMMIRDLGPTDGVSKAGNPWKKHEWVLETFGQYPRKVKITVFGERTNTIKFELGKCYAVMVDVESREVNERWYTDLTAYNFREIQAPQAGPTTPQFQQAPVNPFQNQQPAAPQPEKANPFAGDAAAAFEPTDSQEDLPF